MSASLAQPLVLSGADNDGGEEPVRRQTSAGMETQDEEIARLRAERDAKSGRTKCCKQLCCVFFCLGTIAACCAAYYFYYRRDCKDLLGDESVQLKWNRCGCKTSYQLECDDPTHTCPCTDDDLKVGHCGCYLTLPSGDDVDEKEWAKIIYYFIVLPIAVCRISYSYLYSYLNYTFATLLAFPFLVDLTSSLTSSCSCCIGPNQVCIAAIRRVCRKTCCGRTDPAMMQQQQPPGMMPQQPLGMMQQQPPGNNPFEPARRV